MSVAFTWEKGSAYKGLTMALSQRLDLRQSQALVMTPQLQQAIKLLQLSNLELSAFVEAELEQNPLLERAEGEPDSPREEASAAEAAPEDGVAAESVEMWKAEAGTDGGGDLDLGGDPDAWQVKNGRADGDELSQIDRAQARPISLRDHLLSQVSVDLADPVDRLIARELVELVDEAGYLTTGLESVAERLGCTIARVEETLARIQRFDPPGIFARTLAECLALQLRERDRLDPAMERLIDNLPLLAHRNAAALMRECGVDAEDLALMVAEIKALDPKPGLAFDAATAAPITPDILMRPQPGGGWLIELNSETLPRVLVNTRYYARVSKAAKGKSDREYLSERLQSANWLVKSLHQRATTILKVATEIVQQQQAFFAYGVQYLRPLILRDIAEAIGMHESTVSRVTTNKYLASPRGIFELKYFFTSAIPASGAGEAHSAEAVRFRIKGLIDAETVEDVLSDEKIVEILQKDGIDIARRTVAKYRDSLRIPSSVQRRREKALAF
jgi:RNA polymerase sigma-54 factor